MIPSSTGVKIPPEQAAWNRTVIDRIRTRFPTFARYQGRGLVAQVEVVVTASGALSEPPSLKSTSGDLDFDRMVLAVVGRAELPPPPKAGPVLLLMNSDR